MKRLLLCFFALLIACETQTRGKKDNFITPFETSEGVETATYEETIEFYMELAREYPEINIQTIGETDSGYPLHIVTFNKEADFNFKKLAQSKTIILINNGIHPGESDGIDATMMLYRDLAQENISPPDNSIIVTIPIYNVGGSLNRASKTRANQKGPEKYGFRGNALNYDLNRDFIKCDSKNARTFVQIFHLVQPDIFVDNHVSNGADYQYTLTHLFTQHDKLGGEMGIFLEENFIPDLEKNMSDAGWPITPFVNIYHVPPDNGFSQFLDHPRYSTGYASLWNTLGLMIEGHMLKPYDERVKATYEFLLQLVSYSDREHDQIKSIRTSAATDYQEWIHYPIRWKLDSTRTRTLQFKGYRADTLISEVTGMNRLKYNRDFPYTKEIPYFNSYTPSDSIVIPSAYILGKEWQSVIDLMDLNGITYYTIEQDTVIEVESYRIKDYKTTTFSYEGHYPHFDTTVEKQLVNQSFSTGDYLIPTAQAGIKYLIETLEPTAVDSFFNWNFFDTILHQKEGFSPYVFEDLASELLESNGALRDSFILHKEKNEVFENDRHAQLQWIYERSEYYELAHMQYPVFRILNKGGTQ